VSCVFVCGFNVNKCTHVANYGCKQKVAKT
jgi:hypothetical protein